MKALLEGSLLPALLGLVALAGALAAGAELVLNARGFSLVLLPSYERLYEATQLALLLLIALLLWQLRQRRA